MTNINTLLVRLQSVRKTGRDSWLARCPAHDDRTPSLSIRDTGGKTLIHCFAGCAAHEILDAVGMAFSDLFAERPNFYARPERQPFPPLDVLHAMTFEALVVLTSATALMDNKPFSEADRLRLSQAAGRFQSALSAIAPRLIGSHHD